VVVFVALKGGLKRSWDTSLQPVLSCAVDEWAVGKARRWT
jgi:hypothetical protein